MKDIEWLKGRFRGRKIFTPQNDREIGYNMAIDEFSEYVDQLDESEILSQEWIDDHKLLSTEVDEDGRLHQYYYIHVDDIPETFVPKREKVTVPKFVAVWIEDLKDNGVHLLENIYDFTHEDEINEYIRTNGDTLMKAWQHGYEVEEEQKYIVKDKHGNTMLYKVEDESTFKERAGEIVTRLAVGEVGRQLLTEQEIKDYDERFWPFAVKVEEMEE